ncbi:hypothetical protein IWW45_002422 [Coemansia sp. RSA 485]|nr:hypothetical protein IWW45_002422 [Coemansia sp. RSA 485]
MLNPFGEATNYMSVSQTIRFAKNHKKRNSVSDSIAERLSTMHALYVASGEKYQMRHINQKSAVANLTYIGHLNSLFKTGRLLDYKYFSKDGREIAQLMNLQSPTEFSAYVRKERIYLLKALVRYTLFPDIFYKSRPPLEKHSTFMAEKPMILPLDLSDVEIWMALMISRHGTAMAGQLDECIVNLASSFIAESKRRGYRFTDAHKINKDTPKWLLARTLSDMLNINMGVPEYMVNEIHASEEKYKRKQKASIPVVLPQPLFAPTMTKPADASGLKGSPSQISSELIEELVVVVNNFPVSEEKNKYIQNFLDSYFVQNNQNKDG